MHAVRQCSRAAVRLVAMSLAVTLGACFSFQSPGLVIDRRILGIAAEPPELIFGDTTDAGVSVFNVPIQVTALVVDPKDTGAPQTYKWSWCLPDLNQQGFYDPDTSRCLEQSSNIFDQGAAPLAQLNTQFTASTAVTLLTSALGGMGAASLDGLVGMVDAGPSLPTDDLSTYLMFMLDVEGDADSNGDLYGIKRVVLSTPGPGNRQPNHNPQMTGLLFDDQVWDPDTPLTIQLKNCPADMQTTVADPNKGNAQVVVCQHRIDPVFTASQAETYQVQEDSLDAQGQYQVLTLQETLSFSWTTNDGELTDDFTGTQSNLGPQVYDPYFTDWIEPPELTMGTVTFWIIFQDDRGGESWEIRQLNLTD